MPTREEILAQFTAGGAGSPAAEPGADRKAILAKFTSGSAFSGEEPTATAPERTMGEDIRDGFGAFTQGITFGGGDEVGSALTASLAQLTGVSPEGESWGSTYDQMMDINKNQRAEFSDANPGTALGLELAGGLATGGAGAGRVLGSQAVKQAPKLIKALAPVAVGAVEGGIAGGLSANQGERVKGAAIGTALGGGFSALPAAAKKVFDTATKRRVAQELGQGDDFLPLNQADQGGLGNFYRSVVGKTFGGRQNLIDQSAPQIGTANRRLATADDRLTSVQNAKAESVRRGNNRVDKRYAGKTAQAETLAEDSVNEAQRLADMSVNDATTNMTREVIESGIPASFPIELAAKIRVAGPEEANRLMTKGWKDHGFKSVNNKSYAATAEQVKDHFIETIGRDPAMKDASAGFESMVDDIFETYSTKNGEISGKAIMELRNAMKAKKGGDGRDALVPAVYGKMADQLDVLLKRGMTETEELMFADDLSKYGGKKTLSQSVYNARTSRQGVPNEADVIGAARTARGGQYTQGQGIGQQAAENVQRAQQAGAETVEAAKVNAKAGLKQAKAKIAQGKSALKQGNKRTGNKAVQRATGNLDAATARKKALDATSPADNVSVFEQLFATGLHGFGYGAGNLVSGTTLSRGMTSPNAQRALAGQTGKQKALAEILRKNSDKWDMITAGTGGAAGTQTDEF